MYIDAASLKYCFTVSSSLPCLRGYLGLDHITNCDTHAGKVGGGPLGKRSESYNAKINCGHQDSCGDHLFIADEADSVKNLCWGYEKDCRKENRLFLPQCQSPPKPWYALIHKSKLKSHCMSNIALLQNLAPFHSMRLSCNNI